MIGQAWLQLDLCIGCAVTHSYINRAGPPLFAMLSVQSHPPLKLTLGTPTLSPKPWVPSKTHVCAEIAQHSCHHHVNQRGECQLELKETLEGKEIPEGHTEYLLEYSKLVPQSHLAPQLLPQNTTAVMT